MIQVLGTGSVGIFLASRLSRVAKVTLLARAGGGDASAKESSVFRTEGLESSSYPIPLREWDEGSGSGTFDPDDTFVIACKAFDLDHLLRELRPRIHSGSRIVLIQNGIGILDQARRILPAASLGRLICWFGVRRTSPRVVEWAGDGAMDWAAEDPSFQSEFGQMLRLAGFQPREGATAQQAEWGKALMNVTLNALCAVVDAPNGRILEDAGLRRAAEILLEEALAVARTQTVALDEISARSQVWDGIQSVAKNTNSTSQDLKAGRPTEIPWLNGAMVRLGKASGVPTPAHELIVGMMAVLEKRGIEKTLNSHLANGTHPG